MSDHLHYSVIHGIPKGRTDKERLEIMWQAMKDAHMLSERHLTTEERASAHREQSASEPGPVVTNAAGEPAPEVAPYQADFETVQDGLTTHARLAALSRLQDRMRRMEEALIIVEDAASRSPWSTEIWPNGMHPNAGVSLIRAALGARTDGK